MKGWPVTLLVIGILVGGGLGFLAGNDFRLAKETSPAPPAAQATPTADPCPLPVIERAGLPWAAQMVCKDLGHVPPAMMRKLQKAGTVIEIVPPRDPLLGSFTKWTMGTRIFLSPEALDLALYEVCLVLDNIEGGALAKRARAVQQQDRRLASLMLKELWATACNKYLHPHSPLWEGYPAMIQMVREYMQEIEAER